MVRPEKISPFIKGSVATSSLVAGIMNAKYVNGMPLARQEREFARYDLNPSTKTMANWIINCADNRYLSLLYKRMKEEFLKSYYIHCDETGIQIRKAQHKIGCGYILQTVTVKLRKWFSLIMKGHVQDIIR